MNKLEDGSIYRSFTTNALPQDVKSDLEHMVVRYPVRYQPTGESMLLTGSLINLGDERVELSQGSIAEPTALSTGVCKVCAFRDELEADWDSFCKGPVKWLVNAVPALKVCSGVECGIDCPHFHPAIEEKIDQMIMDLWNRQFQTLDGKKADPKHAAVFSALIRVPRSALDQLQLGHAEGIYVEPRSDTGVGTSEGYKVIWVPGIGKEKAKHIVRTQPKAITVARLGSKYGIRVRDQDEEALFNIVRPGFQFIKANVSRKYSVHPVPHGTQRSDMIRLLKEWGWVARPLQPARGDSAGASWLIGSEHEPPQGALATGNGEAIAMQVGGSSARLRERRRSTPVSAPSFSCSRQGVAPKGARRPLGEGARSMVFLSLSTRSVHSAAQTASRGTTRLAALESTLKQSVCSTAEQQVATAVQDHAAKAEKQAEARFQKLEANMEELRAQNVKFEEWVHQVSGQVAQTSSDLQEVQVAVSHQEATLQNMSQQLQTQAESTHVSIQQSVQQSFQTMQAGFAQQMQVQFQSQMEQFQSMLAKRKQPDN